MLTKIDFKDFDIDQEKQTRSKGYRKKRYHSGEGADFIQLIKGWGQIIGKEFAANTIPLRISNKKLIILTPHITFSQQIIFNEQFILQKIKEKFPSFKNQIHQLRFKVNPNYFLQQSNTTIIQKNLKQPTVQTLPHKYSPEYKQWKKEGQQIYQSIEDNELREQLISLYIQSCFLTK